MKEYQHLHCRRCDCTTLHTQRCVNHFLQLIISLISCGFWIPVWFLLLTVEEFWPAPWKCTQCGQLLGEPTPSEVAIRRRLKDGIRRAKAQVRAEKIAEWKAAAGRGCDAIANAAAAGVKAATAWIAVQVRNAPANVDKAITLICGGPQNTILIGFARIALVALLISAAVLAGAWLASAITAPMR